MIPASPWTITPQQVIDSPEISVLVFHNVYPEGKQGGLEILQHGERTATNGDLRLEAAPGQWAPLPKVQSRAVGGADSQIAVSLAFPQPEIRYTVRVWTEGEQVEVAVDLDAPLPEEWVGKAGFNLELMPGLYFGHTYFMDEKGGAFPRQGSGPVSQDASGQVLPEPMARGRRLVAAPDDRYHCLTVRAHHGELLLIDGRLTNENGWFVVRQAVPAGATRDAVRWTITPRRVAGWRRAPVLLHSQVGYHPDQEKQALIELDPNATTNVECVLLRLQPQGDAQAVLRALPEPLGRFLKYQYARFDFTSVREAGLYQLQYGPVTSPSFQISREVYQQGVWQPTLETFLPVQMCHVRVEDLARVWHGACHLDDALQAPPDHEHFDGYRQYAELETQFPALTNIPSLDRGGWHDAGDYDLAAGSQSQTTYQLALARELFGLNSDQTTILPGERRVILHKPDGVPDVVQQVAHGVENLLGGYRAVGHSFSGIIESNLKQYTYLGDGACMTDNAVTEGGPDHSDDRWAFTNRSTALEYTVAATLAAASRVLRGNFDTGHFSALADECLETALRVWDYEHNHEPATRQVVYIWNNPLLGEVMAAVELLIATGEAQYGMRLVELWPDIEKVFGHLGWAMLRALDYLPKAGIAVGDLREKVRKAAVEYRDQLVSEMAQNPFGLPLGEGWLSANRPDHDPFAEDYRVPIWGIGWSLQSFATHYYYLVRAFPDLFDREPLLRTLNYVLGWHPANSLSLVSGVGAQSLTMAYGTNRAEWSYIPGGIASGPALLRPDIPELMDPFPWLWQQKEYVIGGAASYILLVLAAEQLLNG